LIRLYRAHWSTNCERVALALAHKRIDVESALISYSDRSPVEQISGQPLVPVIVDDDAVISDSTRILRYLEDRYPEPPLFPCAPGARAEMDVFLEWFDVVWKQPSNAIEDQQEGGSPATGTIERAGAQIESWLDLFERLLSRRDFLLGDQLSAADCAAFPFLKYARGRDPEDAELYHRILDEHQSIDGRPRLAAWIDRVDALPRAYGSSAPAKTRQSPD
jgi:glutathione S-transferase